jgi:hypothetical protein
MPEFRFCALKNQLSRALALESEAETTVIKKEEENQEDKEKEEKKDDDAVINVKAEEEGKTEKLTLKENEKEEKKDEKNEKEEKEEKEKMDTKDKFNKEEKKEEKIATEGDKSEGELVIPQGKQYLDFKKFCDLMKLFNPRTPVDAKVTCI